MLTTVQEIFWNSPEGRLRVFWRLLLQVILFLAFAIILTIFAQLLFQINLLSLGQNSPVLFLYNTLGILLSMLLSVWLAGKFLDRRPFPDFGLHLNRNWWLDFGFGLGLGALLMTLIFLVELAAGWITITGAWQTAVSTRSFVLAIFLQVIFFVAVGIQEELLARGYWLRNLAEGLAFLGRIGAVLTAWLISSAIFGVLHAFNPNATFGSTINLVLAGLFLGLAYVLTRSLAIPIGLHITWNFFQGNVFGFPVSGGSSQTSVIAIEQGGPPLWTGGAFGPEAGLMGIAAIIIGSLLILLWVRMRYGQVGLDIGLTVPPVPVERREAVPLEAEEHSREVSTPEREAVRR
jgi:hypothetical protein